MTNSEDKNSNNELEKYEQELLSPSNLAVLLILSEGPMYGYQINKIIESRGMDHWVDLKFSTVYKSLDELNKKGLVRGKKEVNGMKTAKKVYSMTENGNKILVHQITLALKNPPHPKSMFDLGLAGINHLSRGDALSALHEYKAKLNETIPIFKEIINNIQNIDQVSKSTPQKIVAGAPAVLQQQNPMLPIIKALFDRPYHRILGELQWLEKFIEEVEEGKTPHEAKE